MAVRAQFENSDDIGVFARLTNSYCLVSIGGSENFCSFRLHTLELDMLRCRFNLALLVNLTCVQDDRFSYPVHRLGV